MLESVEDTAHWCPRKGKEMAKKNKSKRRKKVNRSPRINVVLSSKSREVVEQLSAENDLPLAQVIVRLVRSCLDDKTNEELGKILYFPDDDDSDYVEVTKALLKKLRSIPEAAFIMDADTAANTAKPVRQSATESIRQPAVQPSLVEMAPTSPLPIPETPTAIEPAETPASVSPVASAPTPAPAADDEPATLAPDPARQKRLALGLIGGQS